MTGQEKVDPSHFSVRSGVSCVSRLPRPSGSTPASSLLCRPTDHDAGREITRHRVVPQVYRRLCKRTFSTSGTLARLAGALNRLRALQDRRGRTDSDLHGTARAVQAKKGTANDRRASFQETQSQDRDAVRRASRFLKRATRDRDWIRAA